VAPEFRALTSGLLGPASRGGIDDHNVCDALNSREHVI
jgi:hypothetical protein